MLHSPLILLCYLVCVLNNSFYFPFTCFAKSLSAPPQVPEDFVTNELTRANAHCCCEAPGLCPDFQAAIPLSYTFFNIEYGIPLLSAFFCKPAIASTYNLLSSIILFSLNLCFAFFIASLLPIPVLNNSLTYDCAWLDNFLNALSKSLVVTPNVLLCTDGLKALVFSNLPVFLYILFLATVDTKGIFALTNFLKSFKSILSKCFESLFACSGDIFLGAVLKDFLSLSIICEVNSFISKASSISLSANSGDLTVDIVFLKTLSLYCLIFFFNTFNLSLSDTSFISVSFFNIFFAKSLFLPFRAAFF